MLGALPELSPTERREVARRTAISAVVVHEAIREEGERELRRPPRALAWSALAAGLSMGFSMVSQGLLRAGIPDVSWRPLIASLGYSVGFLIVVLGRQQLFTENTLTAILPLLAHPNRVTLMKVARLWLIVLIANLLGAFIFATIVGHTDLFQPTVRRAFTALGYDALRGGFGLVVLRAVFAGWLIALMVWLLPSADAGRVWIIIIITYVVSLGGFAHIIAGSVEVLYLVSIGAATWGTFLGGFLAPTLLGNILGGVSLVAALNYAQVAAETSEDDATKGAAAR
ncbi:MAG: formate/nitrite transporter family protein [Ktedonobacterales bacterium]|nr:formate/nitrite transporter family protein [Ktedonobacterales bacterium]